MIPYANNTEIIKFLNKAQNKVADLASLIVDRGGDLPEALTLLLELADFMECLDDKHNVWKEVDILQWIHEYNYRANLNSIPFLLMTGLDINILQEGGGSLGLPITTGDISDYVPATNAIVRATPHNALRTIQGGNATEKYHLTLAELRFLQNLMNPFTPPAVGLVLIANPNVGIHEKGTIVSTVNLLGSYALNSGVSMLRHRYARVGRTPTTLIEVDGSDVLQHTHREDVRVNTTFKFEADFEEGGTKSAEQSINFIAPMWFGIANKGKSVTDIQLLTKVVESPENPRNFVFTLPSNNTTVPISSAKVPYILVAKSKGTPSRFEVETFDTKPDWVITGVEATLADGTKENCWLCEFKNAVVGTYTVTVSWAN